MRLPISFTPEGLALSDAPRFVSATDGDTPTIQIPVRMLGMDAPELHFRGANENNPGKFDDDLKNFLSDAGASLSPDLKNFLRPKLKGKPSTRHIESGKQAHIFFEAQVEKRLARFHKTSGKPITPRKLFTKVAQEVFDSNRRMLAYIAPSFTKEERQTIPEKKRPTFNLELMQWGHAISLLIFPNVPKESDLLLVRSSIRKARQYDRGVWGDSHPPLHAYEFRWMVRMIGGDGDGPTRFCGDFTTGELFHPHDYFRVPDENRLWFFEDDLGRAIEMGFKLQK